MYQVGTKMFYADNTSGLENENTLMSVFLLGKPCSHTKCTHVVCEQNAVAIGNR